MSKTRPGSQREVAGDSAAADARRPLAAELGADRLAILAKVAGIVPPGDLAPWWDRLAKAAAENGVAAEVSSAGWRKPAAEAYPAPGLLARFKAAGVPVTTASDAHELALVADGTDRLRYTAGPYAEELLAARAASDDATFISGIKQQMGL